ncbi:MAG: histidine phosphatase family protein [Candidatus Hydrogenedentota bacterium]
MEIFLVRHGESVDNSERRIQGWSGSSLTDHGRAEAGRVTERLRGRNIEALYTSDLQRATETAGIMGAGLDLVPRPRVEFREMHLGPWEGRLMKEVETTDSDALWKWRWDGRTPPYPDIEPIARFRDRLMSGLDSLVALHRNNVAVVSHGGAISVMLTQIIGLELIRIWQMPTENSSVSRVTHDGEKYYVTSYNETGHLGPGPVSVMNTLG